MKTCATILIFLTLSTSLTAADPKAPIIFTGVGDIMMGTDFPAKYEILPPEDGKYLFEHVKDVLAMGDIVFGNLEQVMIDGGTSEKDVSLPNMWAFRCPTKYAVNLKNAHFNVMSIGNNHAWDFGLEGIASTMQALDSEGIRHSGPKGDVADFTIGETRLVLIAFSFNKNGHYYLDLKESIDLIRYYAGMFDIVIVSFHGGGEGYGALHTRDRVEYLGRENRGNVVRFARAMVDSGADLVVGHGPHVPRALELYQDKLIAYSLGNFCTYGIISIKKEKGLAPILEARLNSTGDFVKGKIHSFRQVPPGSPVPDPKNRAAKLMRKLSLKDFPQSRLRIGRDGSITRIDQ